MHFPTTLRFQKLAKALAVSLDSISNISLQLPNTTELSLAGHEDRERDRKKVKPKARIRKSVEHRQRQRNLLPSVSHSSIPKPLDYL